MFLRPGAVLACLLILFSCGAFAQVAESDPAALRLFDAALGKIEARSVPLRKWQYRQTLTTRQLDAEGDVTASGTWRSIYRPGEKDPIEYTSEELKGSLSFFHKNSEKPGKSVKDSAKTPLDSTPKTGDIDDSQANSRIDSLADAVQKFSLRERYLWSCLPDESVVGEDAAVIAFNPKPDLPAKTREQRFFAQLAGKIWISRADFTVLKSEGALLEPYRVVWVIARITKLAWDYEVEPKPESRLLRRSKATAETVVSFPFRTVRQKHSLEVDEFEARTSRK